MIRKAEMNPFNSILSILIVVGVLAGLYFLVKGFFAILGIITPGLLIGAALLNWKVFPDYAKWIWKQLNNNAVLGVIAILFTVVLFPVVAGYLFIKAWMRYKGKKVLDSYREREEKEFVDFEEVANKPSRPLELPRIETNPVRKQGKNSQDTVDYDQLFD